MIDIRHGDCLPDRVADAIIMDPPYPNRTPSRGQSEKAEALQAANTHGDLNMTGLLWLVREIALESKRLIQPTGSLLVFCDAQMFFQLVP
jgi:methylase of polypeptide subunit release factors